MFLTNLQVPSTFSTFSVIWTAYLPFVAASSCAFSDSLMCEHAEASKAIASAESPKRVFMTIEYRTRGP